MDDYLLIFGSLQSFYGVIGLVFLAENMKRKMLSSCWLSINNISREGVRQKLTFTNRGEGGIKEKLTISY